MVLLVTGLCGHECFYCPLSLEKQGKRVTYANEKLVGDDGDVIFEAESIGAKGTGITGGDPLVEFEKTVHYIELLKETFGQRHNIHLYTATPDLRKLEALADAGLDEIRFHPPLGMWAAIENTIYPAAIERAVETGMRTGIEIPAIPGHEAEMSKLAKAVQAVGAQFMNMNELEFSESNWQELRKRGFGVRDDVSSAVAGSEEAARRVADNLRLDMTLHYCSSGFKDATQLRKRIMRRARNTATPLEIITEEGTFIKGVIECQHPKEEMKRIVSMFRIPEDLIRFDTGGNRVEIAAWILEEIHLDVEGQSFIIEEYPTADGLEVERRPL